MGLRGRHGSAAVGRRQAAKGSTPTHGAPSQALCQLAVRALDGAVRTTMSARNSVCGMDRSYHGEHAPSHQHWEAKHRWA